MCNAILKTGLISFIAILSLSFSDVYADNHAKPGMEKEITESPFTWKKVTPNSIRLLAHGKPLIQYEHPVFNPSDPENTFKPFHHVFDPENGRLITKGPGGRFTHHRGIFFGYNKISVNGGENIDIWHNRHGEFSQHENFLEEITDGDWGGHMVSILWNDTKGQPFAREIRTIKAAWDDPVMIIDFESVLMALRENTIELNGDRQHAGVHFRACNSVDENAEKTFFTRPANLSRIDSKTEIEGPGMLDMPWNAMTFVIEEDTYTVVYMSHPSNPEGAEMSERRYGRFGEFFPYTVTPESPLKVRYRFMILKGRSPSAALMQTWFDGFSKE